MKTNIRLLLLSCIGSLLALGVVGCAATASAPGKDVVMCPKCETVWTRALNPDPDDPFGVTYESTRSMQCPDCQSAAATFFLTGEMAHSCDTCGGGLVHCTLHE